MSINAINSANMSPTVSSTRTSAKQSASISSERSPINRKGQTFGSQASEHGHLQNRASRIRISFSRLGTAVSSQYSAPSTSRQLKDRHVGAENPPKELEMKRTGFADPQRHNDGFSTSFV